jgi:2-phosphosulfolactate phosphatase
VGEAQPDPAEIEACFVAVLEGRLSRDEADRWAARWWLDDTLRWGEPEGWALALLCGIDLRHGPGADYLHDDQQVREWLGELRERRAQRDGLAAARAWKKMDARFLGIPDLTETSTPSVAVVIDVMRAYTVAAWAFARGAETIVLAGSLDEALALKALNREWVALKDGPPAPGFDAVNSPALLQAVDLAGRTVVQKTTAGTVGALAVKDVSLVLCASFVVAEATAQVLRVRDADNVTFVVTGEDGQAEEDLACAQYIARRTTETNTDPADYLRRAAESDAAAELAQGVREGSHPDDVALCLELDRFPFAMVAAWENELMVLRKVSTLR